VVCLKKTKNKQTNKQKNTLFTKYSSPVPVHESTTTAFLLLGETRVHGSTIAEGVTANLDHMCLDNPSHYIHILDVIDFRSCVIFNDM